MVSRFLVVRPYTGVNDGIAKAARPGLLLLVTYIATATNGMLWNNGTFANRKMRGKDTMSVHATGRACDLSYRQLAKGRYGKGRPYAVHVMQWLIRHSEDFGLEMIIDYMPVPYGRGWRCDRGAWQKYEKPTVSGAPNGDWIHVEISPKMADNEQAMQAAIDANPLPPMESFTA